MDWRRREAHCTGSVLFRGKVPPRAEEFRFLKKLGIQVRRVEDTPNPNWMLTLRDPRWGEATAVCLGIPAPPRTLIQWDVNLSNEERQEAALGQSVITVRLEGTHKNILRDRKTLLYFLRALMGDDGVAAMDHTAERFWSRGALDDELCHDADLDIESLYTLHAVQSEQDSEKPDWLHSHGLGNIGFFDFDILHPHADVATRAADLLRALAFAIVEGVAKPTTPHLRLANGGDVRLVEVSSFIRRADPRFVRIVADVDEDHRKNRAILCEPAGWFSRVFSRPQPARWLMEEQLDDFLVFFSDSATALMAERARQMYPVLRRLAAELEEFDMPVLVKLGYRVDGGKPDEREHLWFKTHALREDRIDGTLVNEPFGIDRMKKGDRDWHDIDRITDWIIITPIGPITPRSTTPARAICARRQEFREAMAQVNREKPRTS